MGKVALTAYNQAVAQSMVGNNNPLQRLLELLARNASDSPGGIDPLAKVWFVDGSSTVSPVDGSIGAPFTTIAQAMAVAASGDTVLVAPGTYPESVTVPATLTSLSMLSIGGSAVTHISGAGDANPTVKFSPTVAATDFTLKGFKITANVGEHAVQVSGSSGTDRFTTGVFLDDLRVTVPTASRGVVLISCGVGILNNVLCDRLLNLLTCGTVTVSDCGFDTASLSFDYAGVVPAAGRGFYTFANSSIDGAMTLANTPKVLVDVASRVRSIADGTLTVSTTHGPILIFNGQQGEQGTVSGITLAMPNPAGTDMVIDLRQGRFFGPMAFTIAAGTLPIDARGAFFYATPTGLSTGGAGTIDVDARSATYGTVSIGAGHTFDRDTVTFASAVFAAGTTTVNIDPPLPAGATYVVIPGLTAGLAAGQANDMPFITTPLPASFVVNSNAGATAALLLQRTSS